MCDGTCASAGGSFRVGISSFEKRMGARYITWLRRFRPYVNGTVHRRGSTMSGHNRWSKIKHKKAASDAKKSKGWTKSLKEIVVAAKSGGGDPAGNARLRVAIDKARA